MTHLTPSTLPPPPPRPRRTAQRATIILLSSLLWAPTLACQPGPRPQPAATPARQAPPPQAPPPQAPSPPTARLVIVTVRAATVPDAQALGASLTSAGFAMDPAYAPVSQGPGLFSLRGSLPEAQYGALSGRPDVAGVHADVMIEPMGPPQSRQPPPPTFSLAPDEPSPLPSSGSRSPRRFQLGADPKLVEISLVHP